MRTIDQITCQAFAQGDGELEVTREEYKALWWDVESKRYDPKPMPPVKMESTERAEGLFYTKRKDTIKYDHHAPEYLEELAEWKDRNRERAGFTQLMVGMTKIVIKENDET